MGALLRQHISVDAGPARLQGLDAMRGVAALAVFGFHTQFLLGFDKRVLPPMEVFGRTVTLPNFVSLGASGVTLFFVLSGLCLSLEPLRRARTQPAGPLLDLPLYFRNRFARIYPAYFGALVLSAVEAIWVGGASVRATSADLLVHAVFAHGASGYWFLALNSALWSMATEVQFYLVFPLMMRVLTRLAPARFLALTMGLTIVCRVLAPLLPGASDAHGDMAPARLVAMQLPGRLGEFALGMALAYVYVSGRMFRRRTWAFLVACSLPIALLIRLKGPMPLPELALGVVYTAALALVLVPPARPSAPSKAWTWVSARCAEFGRSSYSFFLIHVPVSAAFARWLKIPTSPSLSHLAYAIAILIPPCVLVSTAMYRLLEMPMWIRLRVSRARPSMYQPSGRVVTTVPHDLPPSP